MKWILSDMTSSSDHAVLRRRFRTSVSVLVLGLTLTGCAHKERVVQSHGIEVRETYAQAAHQPSNAKSAEPEQWIADFKSPVLEVLVAEALENNRDIHIAEANYKRARASLKGQTGRLLPSISAGGGASRSRSNVDDGMGGLQEVISNGYSATADLSWDLDVWGRQIQRRGAAYAEYKAAEERYRGQQLLIAVTTVQAWVNLVEAQETLKILEKSSGIFDQSAQMVRRRYESGLVGALDVRTAEANAAATRGNVEFRKHQLHRAQTALEILLGRYPEAEIAEAGALPQIDPVRIDDVPATLLSRRPDLAASKAELVAAELRRSAAWKDLLPGIRISGSAGWQEGDVDMISDPERLIWSIVGGITQPIFQGGQLMAQAEAAEANGQAALAQYTLVLLGALKDVEDTMSFERHMQEQIAYVRQAAEQSEQAERIAFDQYSRGLIDIFALQNAQRDSLNRQQNYVATQADQIRNRANLYMVIGGGIPGEASDMLAANLSNEPPPVN